jgi:hypothetical protein
VEKKPERVRLLGRPKQRWVDNIKMDLGEIGWGGVDWIGLSQDRDRWRALVNSVMNFGKLSSGFTATQLVLSSIELVLDL